MKLFWAKVKKTSKCWLWTGSKTDSRGYGRFHIKRRPVLAHRVSFWLRHGYWPKVVRHSCDNPSCVRPLHLLGGTQRDNIRDMISRKRQRNQIKTRCPQRHAYSQANTITRNGKRECRQCKRQRDRAAYYARIA